MFPGFSTNNTADARWSYSKLLGKVALTLTLSMKVANPANLFFRQLCSVLARGERLFERPTRSQAIAQSGLVDPDLFAPLRNREPLSIKFNETVGSHVICLLFGCSPLAVLWKISQVVVDTVYAIFWAWPWTHIVNKILETILPTLAYDDASTAIKMIPISGGILAAINHCRPAMKFSYMAKSVSFTSFCDLLAMQATATRSVAASHAIQPDLYYSAAIAAKKPKRLTNSVLLCIAKREQASESLAGKILRALWRSNKLWDFVKGYMFGMHENLLFSCHAWDGYCRCQALCIESLQEYFSTYERDMEGAI